MKNIVNTIKNRVYGHGRGWCFTVGHFSDLESDEAVKKSLQRLHNNGVIRRLAEGLYEYPRKHPKLGLLPPDVNKIAKAIVERDKVRIQPSGAYAANLIGLSEQIPSRIVFITEGTSKKLKIGNQEIIFRKTTPKNMLTAGSEIGLIIQAIKHVGKNYLTDDLNIILKKRLKKIDEKQILKAAQYSPVWIRNILLDLKVKKGRRG